MPQHLRSIANFHLDQSCVTIGSFDGVHIGHQLLIKQFVKAAKEQNCTTVVITFYPHARYVLHNQHDAFYLTSPAEKARKLMDLGVDYVFTMKFTKKLASTSPQQYIKNLHSSLNFRQLWVGNDFALGKDRQGNVDTLEKLGKQHDFLVKTIDDVNDGNIKISSSEIRARISRGDMRNAAHLLGHCYSISGKVISGDHRGRTLGIPTANLKIWNQRLIPAPGVYSTWVNILCNDEIRRFPAVTNVGVHPTFDRVAPIPQIETHILDFSENLYHRFIEVNFVEYIRPEKRFPSAEALINQINADIRFTREVLSPQSNY